MNITIKATDKPLSTEAQLFIEKKFSALEKLVGSSTDSALLACEIDEPVELARDGLKFRVEGNLTVDGKLYRAESRSVTLEGAVDGVRDDLMRDLRTSRGKQRGLVRRGGAALKQMLRFGR
ncbi:MAG: HPF/RaiA family ribosome-associated protein [Minisyncoccia bacterium]